VIAGNGSHGVLITGSLSTGNILEGNYIGTDSSAGTGLGNTIQGVFIHNGASSNRVGGVVAGAGNVIAANGTQPLGGDGVRIFGTGTNQNVVQGNLIGTNAAGIAGLGNTKDGVRIGDSAQGNVIGGTQIEARNIISGNGTNGLEINTSASGNLVQGNSIGATATGAALGNGLHGVIMTSGAVGNTIGGTQSGAGNLIAFNTSDGVDVFDSGTGGAPTGNAILGNSIRDNKGGGSIGIDLFDFDDPVTGNGVTPNL
jgi:titin